MKTEFAKAIEAGEDVLGKTLVCVNDDGWRGRFEEGEVLVVERILHDRMYLTNNTYFSEEYANDFEFKHVLDKESTTTRSSNYYHSAVVAQYSDKIVSLTEQLDGAIEVVKQYEQQLFDMRMENARLELAAQRWEMFNCEANRNIADKLLKKLADEAV